MVEIDEEYLTEIMNSKFTFVDGLLLRDGAWNENTIKEWSDTLKEKGQAIESVINHVHLTQFFWLKEEENLEEKDLKGVGVVFKTHGK